MNTLALSESTNPFEYGLDLLKRINAVVVDGEPLSRKKVFGKYNGWIFFQNRIFFNEIKSFTAGPSFWSVQHPRTGVVDIVLGFFALGISVLAAASLAVFKHPVLVYSVEKINSKVASNDARMDAVYRFLIKFRVRYMECFHSLLGEVFLKNFFKRGRLGLYVPALDFLYNLTRLFNTNKAHACIDVSSFSKEERPFVSYIVPKYCAALKRSEFKIKILRKVLSWSEVKVVLSIDNPRDYHELVIASFENHIPFFAFQHGHFTRYHVGWLNDGTFSGEIIHPQRLYVWSDFWKRELLRSGSYFREDEIVVGGYKAPIPKEIFPEAGNEVGVLIPYEVDSDKEQVKKYIDALLSLSDIWVYFKLRTDIDARKQLESSLLKENYHPRLSIVSEIEPILKNVQVVAGTYSTFLYDMVAYHKPIALLKTGNDFGRGLLENGLAEELTLSDQLEPGLRAAASTPPAVLQERKKKLFGEQPKLLDTTLQEIGEEFNLIHHD